MEKTIQEKDYSISCARLIAMVFIVACHMMQMDGFSSDIKGAHIEWAFWFNVGVQMFLFISGYLYGKKDRIDIVEFYKKNFPKHRYCPWDRAGTRRRSRNAPSYT